MSQSRSRNTPFLGAHRRLGAGMAGFAGWEMPVQYAGPIPGHMAVRTREGIFDVSHVGEAEESGPAALEMVQKVDCNDAGRLAAGRCRYSGETTTALEADPGRICRLGKGDFIGRRALLLQQREGVRRIPVGFEMVERGMARDHNPSRRKAATPGLRRAQSVPPHYGGISAWRICRWKCVPPERHFM